MTPKERCLDCVRFDFSPTRGTGVCPTDPIPRRGICGRCEFDYEPKRQGLFAPPALTKGATA